MKQDKYKYVTIQGKKFMDVVKPESKVLTPDNEHVRQYLSDTNGHKTKK